MLGNVAQHGGPIVWTGRFPNYNDKGDGYAGLASAGSYPPNAYGLNVMAGNAWQWCADRYRPDAHHLSKVTDPEHCLNPADISVFRLGPQAEDPTLE